MLACMEETKRTFMTGSEGMPILAKSQVRKKIEKLKKEKKMKMKSSTWTPKKYASAYGYMWQPPRGVSG